MNKYEALPERHSSMNLFRLIRKGEAFPQGGRQSRFFMPESNE
jgi:hypothetical protein